MDTAVSSHLEVVTREARTSGPLDDLCELIAEVYENNRIRHEPKLGDDTQSFGLLCHRNIYNLGRLRIGQIDEVEVSGAQTLEIQFAGKIWNTSKVTSRDPSWNPHRISWKESDVRTRAARANTHTYPSTEGTLFASLADGAFSPRSVPVEELRYLHLAWQGLGEEGVRIFAGFPQLGLAPWLAVAEITNGRPGMDGIPKTDPSPTSSPNHDAMAEPEFAVKRRPAAGRVAPPSASAGS